jgi:RNA polymerase sigma-70 factor (ECF subfamily)
MASNATSFSELLQRARDGDAAALNELARTYESDLRIAARVHLGPALRPYLDSIDLVQSVHRSLIRGLRDDRFAFDNSAGLIALALTMVRRKIARQWRRHRRQMRLDSPLNVAENATDVLATLTSRSAEPGRAVAIRDSMTRLCRDLNDIDRQLLELRLQGWNTSEIAEQLGHSPEALRIRLFRLRKRLDEANVASEWL